MAFVRITIDLSHDAFFEREGQETADILRTMADRVDNLCLLKSCDAINVTDINGNVVGRLRLDSELEVSGNDA